MECRLSFLFPEEFSNLNPFLDFSLFENVNTGQLLCSEMGLTLTHPFPSCSHICSGILLSAGGAQRPCREKTTFTASLSPLAILGLLFILSKLGKNLVLILTWFKLLDPQPEVLLAVGKKATSLHSELGKLLKNRVL
ncbi:unnamed protein product [Rangifer tarandus platyrhynchus]|uniref:Uncharacterized protein n=2 Tax=Rangifer tarandus platyrhynchus TaxID=3082113 RepID=A0ABN8Y7Q0_RANTA|nr:unnamed protein product [Rangifer tarandus platyrhynchus]